MFFAVVKEPPYSVAESGYGSFNLPIEIYFKTKEEPRKIKFDYDLFLHLNGSPPVNHLRCEKLTFQNPTEDFRRKLIKAGGVSNSFGVLDCTYTLQIVLYIRCYVTTYWGIMMAQWSVNVQVLGSKLARACVCGIIYFSLCRHPSAICLRYDCTEAKQFSWTQPHNLQDMTS